MTIDSEVQVNDVGTTWKQAGGTITMLPGEAYSVFVRVLAGPSDQSDELQIDLRPVFDIPGGVGEVEGAPEQRVHRRRLTQLPAMISVNQNGVRLPAFSVWVRMAEGSQETITSLGVTAAHGI